MFKNLISTGASFLGIYASSFEAMKAGSVDLIKGITATVNDATDTVVAFKKEVDGNKDVQNLKDRMAAIEVPPEGAKEAGKELKMAIKALEASLGKPNKKKAAKKDAPIEQ